MFLNQHTRAQSLTVDYTMSIMLHGHFERGTHQIPFSLQISQRKDEEASKSIGALLKIKPEVNGGLSLSPELFRMFMMLVVHGALGSLSIDLGPIHRNKAPIIGFHFTGQSAGFHER
ncbi:hypothetical protein C2134_04495 [Chromobacterium sinusclupearum]|uniref:Uncharacterized protein n=2 Tax=Chromobacterium sinusclupearum TaxID=2077146 RepID=A0A2K4MS28_9NEIS|nr:hypothetical protein C2134_04495 [Chromobacterium sinusclupearum]